MERSDEEQRASQRVNKRPGYTQEISLTPREKRREKWNTNNDMADYIPGRRRDSYIRADVDPSNPFDLFTYPFRLFVAIIINPILFVVNSFVAALRIFASFGLFVDSFATSRTEKHKNAVIFVVGLAIIGILLYLVSTPNLVVEQRDAVIGEIASIRSLVENIEGKLKDRVEQSLFDSWVKDVSSFKGDLRAQLNSFLTQSQFWENLKTYGAMNKTAVEGLIASRVGSGGGSSMDQNAIRAMIREIVGEVRPSPSPSTVTGGLSRIEVEDIVKQSLSSFRLAADQKQEIVSLVVQQIKKDGNLLPDSVILKLKGMLNAGTVERPDFALASAGATLWERQTTPNYRNTGAWAYLSFFAPARPSSVLHHGTPSPGNCHCFAKPAGNITVQLAQTINVDSVSIDHVSGPVAYTLDSSPQEFEVFGHKDKKDARGTLLGSFNFQKPVSASDGVQTFDLPKDKVATYSIVKFAFKSNYGAKYTCIYRVRVHGQTQK